MPTVHQKFRAIIILQIDCLHEGVSFSKARHYSLSQEAKHRYSLFPSTFIVENCPTLYTQF